MQISAFGIEIEGVEKAQAIGEWLEFTDADGAVIKITPEAIQTLYGYYLKLKDEFWEDEDGDA